MRRTGLKYTLSPSKTKVLILGTFPSEESLQKGEYYANPTNRFWKMIFGVINKEDPKDYKKRIKILKEHGICLWDIVESCDRVGSLDRDIANATPNNLNKFLSAKILVNSTGVKKDIKKYGIPKNYEEAMRFLPSTSGSNNARYSLEKLISEWSTYINKD